MRKNHRMGLVCAMAAGVLLTAGMASANEWMSDYGTALESTRRAEKPLIVVLEKPSEPGARIGQVSQSSDPIGSILLTPYTLCRIDVTTPLGAKVAEAFGASKFPYTAITDKQGKQIIYRNSGAYSDLDWTTMLVSHRAGERVASHVETSSNPADCFT